MEALLDLFGPVGFVFVPPVVLVGIGWIVAGKGLREGIRRGWKAMALEGGAAVLVCGSAALPGSLMTRVAMAGFGLAGLAAIIASVILSKGCRVLALAIGLGTLWLTFFGAFLLSGAYI